MNSCLRSLLAVVLVGLVGCADFSREEQKFCARNPERCGEPLDV
jgi:hypothetical protein